MDMIMMRKFALSILLYMHCSLSLMHSVNAGLDIKHPNVCEETISQEEEVTVSYISRQRIKTLSWCLGIPPRCTHYRDRYRLEHRREWQNVTRTVYVCCAGFEQSTRDADQCIQICDTALGMDSGEISDSAISASSSFDYANYGPHRGRLHEITGGGAWCPENRIEAGSYEWLQIDLGTVHKITAVATQGRFHHGMGREYVGQFKLQYQRIPYSYWMTFTNSNGYTTLDGNVNTYGIVKNPLLPFLVARSVRIVPQHMRTAATTVCLRVELYGCPWTGPVAYSVPQGEAFNDRTSFYDAHYDGRQGNTTLSGGLGLLTDENEGAESFAINDSSTAFENNHGWLRWKCNLTNMAECQNKSLDMLFEFETVRLFSDVYVQVNDMVFGYSSGYVASGFTKARLRFSIGGNYYQPSTVKHLAMPMTSLTGAHHVHIPIRPPRQAQYVQLQLFYRRRWLLVSEVLFTSEAVETEAMCELPAVCDCHPCSHRRCEEVQETFVQPVVYPQDIEGTMCDFNVTVLETTMVPELLSERLAEMTWCMAVPPRCKVYRTKYRMEYTASTQEVLRSVTECCLGYTRQGARCCPYCNDCNGLCVAPGVCLSDIL